VILGNFRWFQLSHYFLKRKNTAMSSSEQRPATQDRRTERHPGHLGSQKARHLEIDKARDLIKDFDVVSGIFHRRASSVMRVEYKSMQRE